MPYVGIEVVVNRNRHWSSQNPNPHGISIKWRGISKALLRAIEE
jgi:hypothetical protein